MDDNRSYGVWQVYEWGHMRVSEEKTRKEIKAMRQLIGKTNREIETDQEEIRAN